MEPIKDINGVCVALFDIGVLLGSENDIPKRKPFKVPHMPAYVKENKRTVNYMPTRRTRIYEPPRKVPVSIEENEI